MKFLGALCVLWVLCGFSFPVLAHALDREAFTFTYYELDVRVESQQQRLGVRGKITLRNDSSLTQKNLSLQISSTLHWSSIQFESKPVDFTSQTYTSDIDHSGALTEAIVILPRPVAPKQTIELEIGYEGVIAQDATRLTRIGVTVEVAKHSDWDQISPSFTGIRGIGYVAWYPVATEAANLSEGNSVLETNDRWKQRESEAEMKATFTRVGDTGTNDMLFCEGATTSANSVQSTVQDSEQSSEKSPEQKSESTGSAVSVRTECSFDSLAIHAPFFIVAKFEILDQPNVQVLFLPGNKSGAENYALAAEETAPFVSQWFGDHKANPENKAEVIELPDPDATPFESGNVLLMPLNVKDSALLLSSLAQLTHVNFPSPRLWIYDGLAHYAQLAFLKERGERPAVLSYLRSHRDALLAAEKPSATDAGPNPSEHSLINSADEFYVQAKAMNVWWMLRDMIGETALHAALHNYKAADDKDAYYMEKLIETQAHRDLAWFFDDWVYRDRGLPDFRIVSVYPRALVSGGYMVTVMVENLGDTAAEVPVTLHLKDSEASARLTVSGKSKASVRIPAATLPQEVTVNDGSVPESDMSNNVFRVESAPEKK